MGRDWRANYESYWLNGERNVHRAAMATDHTALDVTQARVESSLFEDVAVPTYDGSDETVHPCVLYTEGPWNGYKWLMAHTPYPGADSSFENPSLVVSVDGVTWIDFPGLINPVISKPAGGFNSDPFLVFDPFTGKLMMVYRATTSVDQIYLTETDDGLEWSAPIKIFETDNINYRILSPSLSYDFKNSVWVLHGVDTVPAANPISYVTSSVLRTEWAGTLTPCAYTLPSGETTMWHGELRLYADGVWLGVFNSDAGAGGNIFLVRSYDGINLEFSRNLVIRNYKSSLVPAPEGKLYLYSCRVQDLLVKRTVISFDRDTKEYSEDAFLATADVGGARKIGRYNIYDDCIRADNPSSAGSATSGEAWTAQSGTLGILSNAIYSPGAGNDKIGIDSGTSDCDLRVRFSALDASSGAYLTFRYTTAANFWRLKVENTVLTLYSIEGGATVVTELLVDAGTLAGAVIRVILIGPKITIFVNNVIVKTYEYTFNQTATIHGLQITDATARCDLFMVNNV